MAINDMAQLRYADKGQRNRAFDDFIANGNELEKKAVKFSEVEPVVKNGKIVMRANGKPEWRDVWCIAFPRHESTHTRHGKN
jgi:hypothetical protein